MRGGLCRILWFDLTATQLIPIVINMAAGRRSFVDGFFLLVLSQFPTATNSLDPIYYPAGRKMRFLIHIHVLSYNDIRGLPLKNVHKFSAV